MTAVMYRKTFLLASIVLLLGLAGSASAGSGTGDVFDHQFDFESYAGSTALRAVWNSYGNIGDAGGGRALDEGNTYGNAIRMAALSGGTNTAGFGFSAQRATNDSVTPHLNWVGETGIKVWLRAELYNTTSPQTFDKLTYRLVFAEENGDFWKLDVDWMSVSTYGGMPINHATYGVADPNVGGYVYLPWSLFSDFGAGPGDGSLDNGVMDLQSIVRLRVEMYYDHEIGILSTPDSADGIKIVYDNIQAVYVAADPALASNPSPPDSSPAASVQSILSWTPGIYADTHTVYFSTSFNDVDNGTAVVSVNQPGTSYDPNALALNTTYYWRIDEVNSPNTWTGDVWSFTTQATFEPNAGSFAFGVRDIYNTTSLGNKQTAIQQLSQYFDAGTFSINNWGSTNLAEVQNWIDVCEDYNFGFMFNAGGTPSAKVYPNTYTSGDIGGSGYRSVILAADGTFTEQTGNADYDVCSDEAAQYRADQLKAKILQLSTTKVVYFVFNEDTLGGFQTDGSSYRLSPTYSDRDLQSFRNFVGDPNAKFPVDTDITNIPVPSGYKIAYVSLGDPLWDQWWDWRFRAFADYLDKVARAAAEGSAGNANYKGTMYVGMNQSTYEVTGVRMPAVKLEYIADSNYITVLHSDPYGTYTNTSQSETANAAYKSAAQAHGRKFATMEQLWSFNPKALVDLKAIAKQLERNHKYEPDMASVYPAAVFHDSLGFAWGGYNANPVIAEYWDSRENLVPPSSSFRHADFDWGSTRGPNDYNSNPPWIVDVNWDSGGYFNTTASSYKADSGDANYVGSLQVQIDRAIIDDNDITLTIAYTDYASSDMYIQLRDSNGAVLVDLTGNILTGTGKRLQKGFNIPLKDYPDAVWIDIDRYYGDMEIFYSWLERYPGWFLNSYRGEDDPRILSAERGNSFWDVGHSSYRALSIEPNDSGMLTIDINRVEIDDDMTLLLDYMDDVNSYMYIQLREANDTIVIDDLTDNILTGTGERLTTFIAIPFAQYPTASRININRKYGNMQVFSARMSARKPWLILNDATDCYWDPNRYSWRADAADPNGQGYYRTRVDKPNVETLSEGTMILTYTDYNDANMYIQTVDGSLTPISNITGNILTGTGQKLTKRIPIDLSNTSIRNILIRRSSGDFEVWPPSWTGKPWYLSAENIKVSQIDNTSSSYWDYDRNSFIITGGSYVGVKLNRSKMNEDLILTIDYTDYDPATSDMSIRLRGSTWSNIVVSDLLGNILTGTGDRLTKSFYIPISEHSDAYWINIRRNSGSYELFSARLSVADSAVTTMIDDFESYADTTALQAEWSSYVPSSEIFIRELDSGVSAPDNTSQSIKITFQPNLVTDGWGVSRHNGGWNFTDKDGISLWVKADVPNSNYALELYWNDLPNDDQWRSPQVDLASLDPNGEYVFIPFSSFYDNNPGGPGDGAMSAGASRFYVGMIYNGTPSAGSTGTMWVDNIRAPATTVSGTVTYDGYVDSSALFDFELREPGTDTIIANAAEDQMPGTPGTQIVVPMSGGVGTYSLTNVPEDTYDITIKKSNTLREIQAGVSVAAASSTTDVDYTIRGGDADDDNNIDYSDVGILADDWVGGTAGPADFNGDGEVNFNDYVIMAINWLESGVL